MGGGTGRHLSGCAAVGAQCRWTAAGCCLLWGAKASSSPVGWWFCAACGSGDPRLAQQRDAPPDAALSSLFPIPWLVDSKPAWCCPSRQARPRPSQPHDTRDPHRPVPCAGSELVQRTIAAMAAGGCEEVALEAEVTNSAALRLYQKLGFIRDKRLHRQDARPRCASQARCQLGSCHCGSGSWPAQERMHTGRLLAGPSRPALPAAAPPHCGRCSVALAADQCLLAHLHNGCHPRPRPRRPISQHLSSTAPPPRPSGPPTAGTTCLAAMPTGSSCCCRALQPREGEKSWRQQSSCSSWGWESKRSRGRSMGSSQTWQRGLPSSSGMASTTSRRQLKAFGAPRTRDTINCSQGTFWKRKFGFKQPAADKQESERCARRNGAVAWRHVLVPASTCPALNRRRQLRCSRQLQRVKPISHDSCCDCASLMADQMSGGASTKKTAAAALGSKGSASSRLPYLIAPPSAKLVAASLSRNTESLSVIDVCVVSCTRTGSGSAASRKQAAT